MAIIGTGSVTRTPTNYLTLVQRTIQECQVPSAVTVTSVVDEDEGQGLDFCNWVNEAWREIQGKYEDWGWKLISPGVSFVTIAAQTFYTADEAGVPEQAVKYWDRQSFRRYLTASGTASEQFMTYVDYRTWRDQYHLGALRTAQVVPIVFSVHPADLSLCLPCPLAGYTITGDYYQVVTSLEADEDVPNIPSEFIMAIVYRAVMFYGNAEGARDVSADAEKNFNKLMGRLENTRLMEVTGPGALA